MANKEMIEKKIKRGEFTIKIGSTDRNNPRVLFFEGTTYVKPTFETESYVEIINGIEKYLRRQITEMVKKSTIFEGDYIAHLNLPSERMKKDKYSRLRFEYYLIQPKESVISVKDILKENLNEHLIPFIEMEKKFKEFDFEISNNKPKPTI